MTNDVPSPIGFPPISRPRFKLLHDIDETDRIDVEHGRRIRVVAHLWWIPRDANQIADPGRGRAEQVGLYSQNIAISTRVVQNRFDSNLLLHD